MNRKQELIKMQEDRIVKTAQWKIEFAGIIEAVVASVEKVSERVKEVAKNVSEHDWRIKKLESIQPVHGKDGKDGAPGADGQVGQPGPVGPRGEKGEKGDPGMPGAMGLQGEKGKDGVTPVKGIDYYTDQEIQGVIQDVVNRVMITAKALKPNEPQNLDELAKEIQKNVLDALKKEKKGIDEKRVIELISQVKQGAKVINQANWGMVSGKITDQKDLVKYIATHGGSGGSIPQGVVFHRDLNGDWSSIELQDGTVFTCSRVNRMINEISNGIYRWIFERSESGSISNLVVQNI